MSGSLPHSIAISNHTQTNTTQPGYVAFDVRSDEDKNMTALNARNAKASSDHIVTISPEAQELSQQNQKKTDEVKADPYNALLNELDEEFIEEDLLPINASTHKEIKSEYEEKTPTGDYLDQTI